MKYYLVLSIFLALSATAVQAVEEEESHGEPVDDAVVVEPEIEDAVIRVTIVDPVADEALVEDTVDCLYQKPDCVCPEVEEPVCAANNCTYGNDCKRLCADAEFAYDGACQEVIDHEEVEE
ncbi:uncharacterized protein LOC114356517 [Ostrinia furnacalis]|uniref:uncharacterized protein LOC114356517 n=1 Tax=Ostrinia furnacalis TaxID=93504 RepID=UPI00103B2104|nr:uncharacterized protein LOC114356517 [Ostrinia furnacalis]